MPIGCVKAVYGGWNELAEIAVPKERGRRGKREGGAVSMDAGAETITTWTRSQFQKAAL